MSRLYKTAGDKQDAGGKTQTFFGCWQRKKFSFGMVDDLTLHKVSPSAKTKPGHIITFKIHTVSTLNSSAPDIIGTVTRRVNYVFCLGTGY